jgi:hypothetical protein
VAGEKELRERDSSLQGPQTLGDLSSRCHPPGPSQETEFLCFLPSSRSQLRPLACLTLNPDYEQSSVGCWGFMWDCLPPPHAFAQRREERTGGKLPRAAGVWARGFLSALWPDDTHSPELPGIITYSFPNKSCPSFRLLCTLVLWVPTLVAY